MTPDQIAILRAMSPNLTMDVATIAGAAFGKSTVRNRQRVYRALALHRTKTVWINGTRWIDAFDGCVTAETDLWPRRWLLTGAGIAVRQQLNAEVLYV